MLCSLLVLLLLIVTQHLRTLHTWLSAFSNALSEFPNATTLPIETRPTTLTTMTAVSSSTPISSGQQKRHRSVSDKNGEDSNGNGSGSKRRKTLTYHPNRVQCLPCALWQQSGSDLNLQHLHPLKDSRHVGSDEVPLSQYASYDDIVFDLTRDDCICKPCYIDFKRKYRENQCIPRWARVKKEYYSTRPNRHCIYCCDQECSCESIHLWGPDQWHGDNTSIGTWKKFLTLTSKVDHVIPDHICKVHYRSVLKLKETQSCSICNSSDSTSWSLACDVTPTPQDVDRMFHLELGSVQFFSWMCGQCTLCFRNDVRLQNQLANDERSLDPMTSHKSQLLLKTLDCLRRDGVIFTKDVMAQYKLVLTNLNVPQAQHSRLCNAFGKYLSQLTRLYKIFSPTSTSHHGRAIYDEQKFNDYSLRYIFNMREKVKKSISIKHLQDLIRNQISTFPSSKQINYTDLISRKSTSMEIDGYFDQELFNLIDTV